MKKVAVIVILMLGFTLTTQAQKKQKFEKLSLEQRTELRIKQMTLALDLTPTQANQIKPLIAEQVKERKEMRKKHKELRKSDKKPTADERYAMKMAKLDKQIAFKNKMKQVLNEKQYEKFEKTIKRKMKDKRKKHNKRNKF